MATYIVSYSGLSNARQCLHKYDLNDRQHWVSRRQAQALTRGLFWHAVLEAHYSVLQVGGPLRQAVKAARDVIKSADVDDELRDLIDWMYAGYVACYGNDSQWQILAVEHEMRVPLPKDEDDPDDWILAMRLDLVIWDRVDQRLKIVDHKSHTRLPSDREMDIDDQFGLYTWGTRKLGKKVFCSIYSTARAEHLVRDMTMDERFSRDDIFRNQRELDTIAREAYEWAKLAHMYEEGKTPRSPNPRECRRWCPFTDPCLTGRKMGWKAELQFLQAAYDKQPTRYPPLDGEET